MHWIGYAPTAMHLSTKAGRRKCIKRGSLKAVDASIYIYIYIHIYIYYMYIYIQGSGWPVDHFDLVAWDIEPQWVSICGFSGVSLDPVLPWPQRCRRRRPGKCSLPSVSCLRPFAGIKASNYSQSASMLVDLSRLFEAVPSLRCHCLATQGQKNKWKLWHFPLMRAKMCALPN